MNFFKILFLGIVGYGFYRLGTYKNELDSLTFNIATETQQGTNYVMLKNGVITYTLDQNEAKKFKYFDAVNLKKILNKYGDQVFELVTISDIVNISYIYE